MGSPVFDRRGQDAACRSCLRHVGKCTVYAIGPRNHGRLYRVGFLSPLSQSDTNQYKVRVSLLPSVSPFLEVTYRPRILMTSSPSAPHSTSPRWQSPH
jgi:hypothetical protein